MAPSYWAVGHSRSSASISCSYCRRHCGCTWGTNSSWSQLSSVQSSGACPSDSWTNKVKTLKEWTCQKAQSIRLGQYHTALEKGVSQLDTQSSEILILVIWNSTNGLMTSCKMSQSRTNWYIKRMLRSWQLGQQRPSSIILSSTPTQRSTAWYGAPASG